MRIIFVNRFYWPAAPATGQLLTDLATALARRGHKVTVITSRPSGTPATETHDGVEIHRVWATGRRDTAAIAKLGAFLAFGAGALWQLFRLTRRGDVVVILSDPPLLGIAARYVVAAKGGHLVHWIQDVYPEIAIELTKHRWLQVFRLPRNAAWTAADRCVTLGTAMAGVVREAGVQANAIVISPNWAPAELAAAAPPLTEVARLRDQWQVADRFVVGYSGNFGRVHDLAVVIAAAERLLDHPRIAFVLIGEGAQRENIAAEIGRRGLRNVMLLPPVPRTTLPTSLAAADVHLVTLKVGCERYVYPSKLYGIAAAARPMIFVGPTDSETALTIVNHGMGLAVTPAPEALAAAIVRLSTDADALAAFGRTAGRFGQANSVSRAVAEWETMLESIHAC